MPSIEVRRSGLPGHLPLLSQSSVRSAEQARMSATCANEPGMRKSLVISVYVQRFIGSAMIIARDLPRNTAKLQRSGMARDASQERSSRSQRSRLCNQTTEASRRRHPLPLLGGEGRGEGERSTDSAAVVAAPSAPSRSLGWAATCPGTPASSSGAGARYSRLLCGRMIKPDSGGFHLLACCCQREALRRAHQ